MLLRAFKKITKEKCWGNPLQVTRFM